MKNIFTRALALTIVFVLCAVSAFAAPTVTSANYDLEAGTIDVATNGYTAGKSATLLVVKAGANLASLAANDIIYIDQEDNLAAADQAWTDIPLADRIAALNAAKAEGAADITSVNVYIGGTDVTAAVPYGTDDGTGNIVPAAIAVAEEEPTPVTYTYTATFNTASSEFASVDAAIAALVVTKNGSDGSTATLTAADYTTDTTAANTIKVLVAGVEVGSVTYTIADVGGDEPAKTAIAGTVKYKLGANWRNGEGALVLVVNSGAATIAGSAVADANGAFEVEVPAGTYNVVVRYSRLGYNTSTKVFSVTNYANTRFDGITVTEGATTTLASADVDYVVMNARAKGDATDDGVVDTADLTAVKQGLVAAAK